ncbi:MAG: hypothetical protein IT423_02990, partial [Pirellulaceae bacterium]|nr:hypothetical protein [Pirellulaceae bacterium]
MMSRTRLPIAITGLRFFTRFPTRVPTSTPTRFNTRLLACFVASLILSVCGAEHLCAQTQFELGAPGLNRTSKATIAGRELRIVDQTGRETVYFREPGMDTADGQFTAYRSTALAQVIRWPTSN